jgi:hypothetical protein
VPHQFEIRFKLLEDGIYRGQQALFHDAVVAVVGQREIRFSPQKACTRHLLER